MSIWIEISLLGKKTDTALLLYTPMLPLDVSKTYTLDATLDYTFDKFQHLIAYIM